MHFSVHNRWSSVLRYRGHTVGREFWSYRTFHLIVRRNSTYKQHLDIFHTLSTTVGTKFWSYRTFHLIFRRNRTTKQHLDIFHTLSTTVRTRCLAESEVLANGAAAPKWRRLSIFSPTARGRFSTLYSTLGRECPYMLWNIILWYFFFFFSNIPSGVCVKTQSNCIKQANM